MTTAYVTDMRFDAHREFSLSRQMVEAEFVFAPGRRVAIPKATVDLDRPGIEKRSPEERRVGNRR